MLAPASDALSPSAGPLLAADVGSVYTKVYLLDNVEGERRLVAVGRSPTLGDDGQPAVPAALQAAEDRALATAGYPPGTVAQRTLITSIGALLRVAVVAANDQDYQAAAAALASVPVRLLEPLSLGQPAGGVETLLSQIEALSPDVAVLIAGARAGDRAAFVAAAEALGRAFPAKLLQLVLTGDEQAVAQAAARLTDRQHVAVPGRGGALPVAAVRRLIAERVGGETLDRRALESWLAVQPIGSSLDGVVATTERIAERYDVDVLTLDLGASHALAVLATGTAGRRRVVSLARDDLGIQFGRQTVLRQVGARAVAQWLPIDYDDVALRVAACNGRSAPAALPERVEDLLVEHAYAREALRLVTGHLAALAQPGMPEPALPPIDLLIGSGGLLAGVPRLMQAALILLDAVQPEALTQLALDRTTALPLIGRLWAESESRVLGASLERDGLLNLGLCIAPIGSGKEGENAITVEVVYASRSPVTIEVPFGAIEVVALPVGERASLKLWPAREFDVGLGRGNAATPRADVEGGAVGIIIDARGRPLVLPDAIDKRQAKLLQWHQTTRAYPPLSFVEGPSGDRHKLAPQER